MQVFDAHRLVGRLPAGQTGATDLDGLLADLDHLGIDACAVTATAALFGDPADPLARDLLAHAEVPAAGGRCVTVPVILPAVGGAGWPDTVEDVLAASPPLVRACPVRHRFDPLGRVAAGWWRELAVHRLPVAVDVSECGLPLVAALATAHPELPLLLLSPGYRELRRLAELLDSFPHLYLETGTIVAAGALEWLAGRYGAHRLVFGTGAPLWDDAGARFLLDHLELPEADQTMIAAGSARTLLGTRWPW